MATQVPSTQNKIKYKKCEYKHFFLTKNIFFLPLWDVYSLNNFTENSQYFVKQNCISVSFPASSALRARYKIKGKHFAAVFERRENDHTGKRKHKLNLGWGIVFSQRMRIRKTCSETRTFSTTLTSWQKKLKKNKDVWKVRRKWLLALLLSVVPGGIQKKRLNILSEGCRETVACEKDGVSIVKLQRYSALNYAYYSR